MTPFWSETGRLLVQFIGALIVARLTVTWALDRFKSEKSWERSLAAHADVVRALMEMRDILRVSRSQALRRQEPTYEEAARQSEGYESARRKIEEELLVGRFLLPPPAIQIVETLQNDVDLLYADHFSWESHVVAELGYVETALAKFTDTGRHVLLGTIHPRFFHDPAAWLKMKNLKRLSYADQKQK